MKMADVMLYGEADGIEVTTTIGPQWIPGDLAIATSEDGSLHIHDDDQTVVVYPSGTWMRAKRVMGPRLAEIEAARRPGEHHLLTGNAGTGKSTLMRALAQRAMLTAPLIQQDNILIGNNEEVLVKDIRPGKFRWAFQGGAEHSGWTATLPAWEVTLERDDGLQVDAHFVSDAAALNKVDARIREEAAAQRYRWVERHNMLGALARMQSIYALTVHRSQGSTFGVTFVDIGDIARRADDNPLECQQMLYVAMTRPSRAAVLAGVS